MYVHELKDILEMLDDDLEIVKDEVYGKDPVVSVSIFKNTNGEPKAIFE